MSTDTDNEQPPKAAKKAAKKAARTREAEKAAVEHRERQIRALQERARRLSQQIQMLASSDTPAEQQEAARKEGTRAAVIHRLNGLLSPETRHQEEIGKWELAIGNLRQIRDDGYPGLDDEGQRASRRELETAERRLKKLLPRERYEDDERDIKSRTPRPTRLDRLRTALEELKKAEQSAKAKAADTPHDNEHKWFYIKRANELEAERTAKAQEVETEAQKVKDRNDRLAKERAEKEKRREAKQQKPEPRTRPAKQRAPKPAVEPITNKPARPQRSRVETREIKECLAAEGGTMGMDSGVHATTNNGGDGTPTTRVSDTTPSGRAASLEQLDALASRFASKRLPSPAKKGSARGDNSNTGASQKPAVTLASSEEDLIYQLSMRRYEAKKAAAQAEGEVSYQQWLEQNPPPKAPVGYIPPAQQNDKSSGISASERTPVSDILDGVARTHDPLAELLQRQRAAKRAAAEAEGPEALAEWKAQEEARKATLGAKGAAR